MKAKSFIIFLNCGFGLNPTTLENDRKLTSIRKFLFQLCLITCETQMQIVIISNRDIDMGSYERTYHAFLLRDASSITVK